MATSPLALQGGVCDKHGLDKYSTLDKSSNTSLNPQPFSQLPNEILLKVFRHCGPIRLEAGDRSVTPLAPLAEVCATWRSVILGAPDLWDTLSIDFKNWADTRRLTHLARRCIRRSGNFVPLTFSLYTTDEMPSMALLDRIGHANPVSVLLAPFSHRLRHLRLSLPVDWTIDFLRLPAGSTPVLESIDIETTPYGIYFLVRQSLMPGSAITAFTGAVRLRSVTFRMSVNSGETRSTPPTLALYSISPSRWHQVMDLTLVDVLDALTPHFAYCLLQLCPNLTSCSLLKPGSIKSNDSSPEDLSYLKDLADNADVPF